MIRTVRWFLRSGVIVAVACAMVLSATPAAAATFQRNDIASDEAFRASDSMSKGDIQAFLDAMPGVLARYEAVDHSGTVMPAAQIIGEASRRWGISPKAIVCLLEKEQSLLTLRHPNPARLRKAVGCGIYPGSKNRYPGFGNQIWNGARKLAQYPARFHWKPGSRIPVYGKKFVTPANAATFSMYTYNPSINGNRNWWKIYQRFFGDPHELPWMKPVYRFNDLRTGAHVYTGSEGERYAFLGDRSLEATSAGILLIAEAQATSQRTYPVNGVMVRPSPDAEAGRPVYGLYDTKVGGFVYTLSAGEQDALLARQPGRFEPRGVAFYLAQ